MGRSWWSPYQNPLQTNTLRWQPYGAGARKGKRQNGQHISSLLANVGQEKGKYINKEPSNERRCIMAGSVPYFGGIPTEPDVKKLVEHFPIESLTPGTVIPYKEVAEVIGVDASTSRFKTVTTSWRKRIESEYNCVIKPPKMANETFIVLYENEKPDYAIDEMRSAVKKARRSIVISSITNVSELSDEQKEKYDFVVARSGAMIATANIRGGRKILPKV